MIREFSKANGVLGVCNYTDPDTMCKSEPYNGTCNTAMRYGNVYKGAHIEVCTNGPLLTTISIRQGSASLSISLDNPVARELADLLNNLERYKEDCDAEVEIPKYTGPNLA